MSVNLRKLVAVSYVLALALTLGACGGGGGVSGPTPITTPTPSTVAPAPFARVITAIPESGSTIRPGTRPQVTIEYGLFSGSYTDLRVYACLSVDGGVTYIMDTCSWKPASELTGTKPVSPGELDPGRISNAVVPLLTAGSLLTGDQAILVRGAAAPHTWVW